MRAFGPPFHSGRNTRMPFRAVIGCRQDGRQATLSLPLRPWRRCSIALRGGARLHSALINASDAGARRMSTEQGGARR